MEGGDVSRRSATSESAEGFGGRVSTGHGCAVGEQPNS